MFFISAKVFFPPCHVYLVILWEDVVHFFHLFAGDFFRHQSAFVRRQQQPHALPLLVFERRTASQRHLLVSERRTSWADVESAVKHICPWNFSILKPYSLKFIKIANLYDKLQLWIKFYKYCEHWCSHCFRSTPCSLTAVWLLLAHALKYPCSLNCIRAH